MDAIDLLSNNISFKYVLANEYLKWALQIIAKLHETNSGVHHYAVRVHYFAAGGTYYSL